MSTPAGPTALPARLLAGATYWSYRGLVTVVLVAGLVWALKFGWRVLSTQTVSHDSTAFNLLLLLAVLAGFAGALVLARRKQALDPLRFILTTLAAGLLLRLAYVHFVDAAWINDFLRYWEAAVRLAAADEYRVDGIYDQRALPILVPLIELFGASAAALKGFNIALLLLTQLAGYDILRRLHSHQVAQAFTVIWLMVPETTFTAAIPSHDLTGLALLAFAFWLNIIGTQPAPGRRVLRFVLTTLALSATLVVLEAARNLGTFLILIFVLGSVAGLVLSWIGDRRLGEIRGIAAATLLQAVIGLVLVQGAMGWLADQRLMSDASELEIQKLRAMTPQPNSMADGSYAWFYGFNTTFTMEMMTDAQRFRLMRNAFNLSDYLERPEAVAAKTIERSERLYTLGSQYGFYHAGWMEQHPPAARALQYVNGIYVGVFALLFMLSLMRLMLVPGPPQMYLQALFLAALAFACLTLLYNQPRYIYPIWFVGAGVIALEMARFSPRLARVLPALGSGTLLLLQSALFFVLGGALLWAVLNLAFTDSRGRILSGWSFQTSQSVPADAAATFFARLAASTTDAVPKLRGGHYDADFGPLMLKLEFPQLVAKGDTVRAERELCIDDASPRLLAFHYYTPYKRVERQGAFTLSLLQDGTRIWSGELPAATTAQPALVPLGETATGCHRFAFVLTSNVGYQKESWRRASRTEIFFPRLEPVTPAVAPIAD